MTEQDKIISNLLNSRLRQARGRLSINIVEKKDCEQHLSDISEAIRSGEQEIQAIISTLNKFNLPQES